MPRPGQVGVSKGTRAVDDLRDFWVVLLAKL